TPPPSLIQLITEVSFFTTKPLIISTPISKRTGDKGVLGPSIIVTARSDNSSNLGAVLLTNVEAVINTKSWFGNIYSAAESGKSPKVTSLSRTDKSQCFDN